MCQAIFSRDTINKQQGNPSYGWKVLPCLCCQAAGGDYSWAEDICAAWFLFHNAARLMDNVEDKEISNNNLNIEFSLSAASGLFFTAQYALLKLSQNPHTGHAVDDINHTFIYKLLKMCEGQHQDILQNTPTLEQYWQIAEKKSGNFFSLATYCGARLATNDPRKLSGFEQYGYHLGLLIQLIDDLEDIYQWMHTSIAPSNLKGCLPIVYTMEVVPETEKLLLKNYLTNINDGHFNKQDLINFLDRNGAVLYLSSEIERHAGIAITSLENANALSPAGEKLKEIITKLTSII
jgi:geranylgeranyl pyrophosphate synthase